MLLTKLLALLEDCGSPTESLHKLMENPPFMQGNPLGPAAVGMAIMAVTRVLGVIWVSPLSDWELVRLGEEFVQIAHSDLHVFRLEGEVRADLWPDLGVDLGVGEVQPVEEGLVEDVVARLCQLDDPGTGVTNSPIFREHKRLLTGDGDSCSAVEVVALRDDAYNLSGAFGGRFDLHAWFDED